MKFEYADLYLLLLSCFNTSSKRYETWAFNSSSVFSTHVFWINSARLLLKLLISFSSCSLFCLFYHAFIPCIYVQSYRFFLHNQDKNRQHYYYSQPSFSLVGISPYLLPSCFNQHPVFLNIFQRYSCFFPTETVFYTFLYYKQLGMSENTSHIFWNKRHLF